MASSGGGERGQHARRGRGSNHRWRQKFMQLSDIASNTARSVVLAGSASDGMMTFVTRSKWIGFPDYTTIQLDGDKIKLHARLRFGRSDLGVNAARLERWIDQLNRG